MEMAGGQRPEASELVFRVPYSVNRATFRRNTVNRNQ
jgi:hypothetical protein